MNPTAKITAAIDRRREARLQARDAEGLRALYVAATLGAESVAAAYLELTGKPITEPAEVPAPVADPEEEARKRYEARLIREADKRERSELFRLIQAAGGIRPSTDDLATEYAICIPPTYRSPDGMRGDELADELARCAPQLGITDERSLLAYFGDRRVRDRNARAAA